MPRRYAQVLHSSLRLSSTTNPEPTIVGNSPVAVQYLSGSTNCSPYNFEELRHDPVITAVFLSHMRSHASTILSRTLWEWRWAAKDQQGKKARWTVKHILRWIYGEANQTWCPLPYTLVLQLLIWGTSCHIEDLDRWLLDRMESPRNLPGKCACGRVVKGTCLGDVVECWYCKTKRETADRRRNRYNHGVLLDSTGETPNCQSSIPQDFFVAGV